MILEESLKQIQNNFNGMYFPQVPILDIPQIVDSKRMSSIPAITPYMFPSFLNPNL